MPIYVGQATEPVKSGEWFLGDKDIAKVYHGQDETPIYIGAVTISFLNFPGNDPVVSFTGVPGAVESSSVSWTVDAPAGNAFRYGGTISGLPDGFSYSRSGFGSFTSTTQTFTVYTTATTFPATGLTVDYNDLTVGNPWYGVNTFSYTFTGNLGRSTSCTAWSGDSCNVGSSTRRAGEGRVWSQNASGTGGYGDNSCTQGCVRTISSSGGSSSCNTNGGSTSGGNFNIGIDTLNYSNASYQYLAAHACFTPYSGYSPCGVGGNIWISGPGNSGPGQYNGSFTTDYVATGSPCYIDKYICYNCDQSNQYGCSGTWTIYYCPNGYNQPCTNYGSAGC